MAVFGKALVMPHQPDFGIFLLRKRGHARRIGPRKGRGRRANTYFHVVLFLPKTPFALSLSKGSSHNLCFDKLSTNGCW